MKAVPIIGLAGLTAVALLTACGGGSTTANSANSAVQTPGSVFGSASSTSTVPSTPTTTPTPTTAPAYMPSEVGARALLTVKSMPSAAKVSDSWQREYPSTSSTAGFPSSLVFVSGDPSCEQLLVGHPVQSGSDAYGQLASKHMTATEMVTSFRTLADAKAVMAQNVSQVKKCRTFIASYEGKRYKVSNEGKVSGSADEPEVTRVMTFRLGPNTRWVSWSLETRLGGEVLFFTVAPHDATGIDQESVVAFIAVAKFRDVVKAYRLAHPRTT